MSKISITHDEAVSILRKRRKEVSILSSTDALLECKAIDLAIAALSTLGVPAFIALYALDAYDSSLKEDPMESSSEPARFRAMSMALEAVSPLLELTQPTEADVKWEDAVLVACLDDVDDALRDFAHDPTGDNGTMVVREVMRAMRKRRA